METGKTSESPNETEQIQQKMPNKVHSCHEKKRKKQCELVSCEKQYMCMNHSLCLNILQLHWRCRNRVHSEVHCCVHHQAKLQLLFQYPFFELDGDQQERIWISCVPHITGALVWLQRQNQKTCQFSFCLKALEQTVSLPLLQWRKSAASDIFNDRKSKHKNDSDWGICETFGTSSTAVRALKTERKRKTCWL